MSINAELAHVPELVSRTLACAVIKQALADALDPTLPESIRRDAQDFISGDERYQTWCRTAGMTPRPIYRPRVA